jgi:hypothetical protein
MGLKLVLVIVLLDTAALDWLASAEQGVESPNLTLEEAEQKLSNSSLAPEEVANILNRLSPHFIIDDAYVWGLLLFFHRPMCILWNQRLVECSCTAVSTPSVVNYCKYQTERSKEPCRMEPVQTIEESINFDLKKQLKNELMAALKMAETRGEHLDRFIKNRLDTRKQESFKQSCENFLTFKKEMNNYFNIDVGKVVGDLEETHPSKYFHYANLHCETVLKADFSAGKCNSVRRRLGCL